MLHQDYSRYIKILLKKLEKEYMKYPCHTQNIKALNRIGGQVEGIKKMIADNRYCPDILIQIKAAQAALKRVELKIFEKHLEGCVVKTFSSSNNEEKDAKIQEILKLLAKR